MFQSTPSGGKATGDAASVAQSPPHVGFNPRLPGGRRRHAGDLGCAADEVSIHAFRGEGDQKP